MVDSLKQWNESNRKLSRARIREALENTALGASESFDSFSLWLLAAAGGVGALLIGNLKSAISIVGPSGVRTCGVLLTVSAAFGFLSRYRGAVIALYLTMNEKMATMLNPVLDKHDESAARIRQHAEEAGSPMDTEPDFLGAMSDFASLFPRPLSWFVGRRIRVSYINHAQGAKSAIRSLILQSTYLTLQFLFLLSGFLSLIWFAGQI